MIFKFHQILGLEIKQVDISGTCSAHRSKEDKYKMLIEISEGKKPLGDLRNVCEGIFLIWVIKKEVGNVCVNCIYTVCNRRNGPDLGRVFLRSNYTDITQNTYIQS